MRLLLAVSLSYPSPIIYLLGVGLGCFPTHPPIIYLLGVVVSLSLQVLLVTYSCVLVSYPSVPVCTRMYSYSMYSVTRMYS